MKFDPKAKRLRHPTPSEADAYWTREVHDESEDRRVDWCPPHPIRDLWLYSDGSIRYEMSEETRKELQKAKGDPTGMTWE